MDVSVLPGGMWYENSWSYHFYTLQAIQRTLETTRRLGLDLYPVPQVREMYTVALDYRMIDNTLPRFGDATTATIPGAAYESVYHRWPEPRFLALLPAGPTWDSILYGRTQTPASESPASTSLLKQGPGHAILRTDGPDGPSSAVLSFGPFGGFHGHFDKLSFVYFGLDRELGYDPGRSRSQAYRLPVHRNWYRATTSHNAVLVDRISQEGAAGECELFLATPELSAAVARTDQAYPGFLHRRLLILRPGFLIVADALTSSDGQEHTFDWLYHNCGETVVSPAAGEEGELPAGQGFEYIQDARMGRADGPVRATFAVGDDRVEVVVSTQEDAEVLVGTGVGESILDRIPLLCVTRRGIHARFAAAIDPTRAGQPAEVGDITLTDHQTDGFLIRLELRGGSEELYSYDPEGKGRRVEGVQTQARLLCLRKENQGNWTVLAEGSE